MHDSFFDLYLKRLNELSDDEQKVLLSNNILEESFRKICNYNFVQKHFSNIFCDNLHMLREESNLSLLHLLLTKCSYAHFKEYLFANLQFLENLEMLAYLKIYEKIYEYTIQNIFLENCQDFDLSREILNFFWFSTNHELKAQSFEMSMCHFEKLFLVNKHNMGQHTKEYLAQLEKDAYLKKFVH
ncbi:hypothetical protein AK88_01934 [Plasmodium fragile]|uniref:Uncharacterized protein n=1 Tax=Plasmodium fragile TaxID=5857 RepID=A0A0D9QNV2_PLAFR|nr:uncharacterized protein AK88_01934 [Plasmodium fragile]KJP88482.1 hypothetical protein AK88_01934 [Plasmodium fragile]